MSRGATRRLLAITVAALLAWPGVVAAAPAGVHVDASGLEAVGEELAPEVARELTALVEREGIDPASLRVRIVWLNAEEFHYAIYGTLDRSLPDDQMPIIETCSDCSKQAVVKKAVAGVEKLVAQEKERLANSEPVAEPSTDPAPGGVTPADRPSRSKTPLQPMGWAGVGLLVGGAAIAITGGAFLGVGETRPAIDMSQIRDWRPSGYILLGTGAAMLVVGAILLGVDRGRAKKSKATAGLLRGRF
jgi:hypothetical protein